MSLFSKFVEKIDPRLHKEYIKERFLNGETGKHNYKKPVLFSPPKFKNKVKINLQSIEDLEEGHWVRRYVYERAIPDSYYSSLYFAPDFKKFVQETGSPKYADLKEEDPRKPKLPIEKEWEDHSLSTRASSGNLNKENGATVFYSL